jgi:hypothetical protein
LPRNLSVGITARLADIDTAAALRRLTPRRGF